MMNGEEFSTPQQSGRLNDHSLGSFFPDVKRIGSGRSIDEMGWVRFSRTVSLIGGMALHRFWVVRAVTRSVGLPIFDGGDGCD
jgi:hypothetical protein